MQALGRGFAAQALGLARALELLADALELGIAETVRDYQRCIQNAFSASKTPLARPGGGTSPLPR